MNLFKEKNRCLKINLLYGHVSSGQKILKISFDFSVSPKMIYEINERERKEPKKLNQEVASNNFSDFSS